MNSKIKNIIIIGIVAIVLVLIYIFFIRKAPEATLTTSTGAPVTGSTNADTNIQTVQIGQDFISLLLSVKNIKLDDSIFKDEAFISLKDSSILLIPTENEGRPNPFAPIGSDTTITQTNSLNLNTNPPIQTPSNIIPAPTN